MRLDNYDFFRTRLELVLLKLETWLKFADCNPECLTFHQDLINFSCNFWCEIVTLGALRTWMTWVCWAMRRAIKYPCLLAWHGWKIRRSAHGKSMWPVLNLCLHYLCSNIAKIRIFCLTCCTFLKEKMQTDGRRDDGMGVQRAREK